MPDKNQRISLIAAMSENHVIGKNNKLPWVMPADWDNFHIITKGKSFIMGRNSYLSEDRLLSSRKSVILSHHELYELEDRCYWAPDFKQALELLKNEKEIFILGGESIFRQTLPLADYIYLTIIHSHIKGDSFFPDIDMKNWKVVRSDSHRKDRNNPYPYSFMEYIKVNDI